MFERRSNSLFKYNKSFSTILTGLAIFSARYRYAYAENNAPNFSLIDFHFGGLMRQRLIYILCYHPSCLEE
ncbi:hypothetical protein RCL_jg21429.t1 [Rhizophagus clarus]|uniref:Uncharacterized protein n=1 Tax=Rhizophagus clarus TaxID=94130 RepID=A0A8H3LRR0_9GLOM|nr:hypothetical protein RCL_jg21429.t1 [Rhizophagus clarus]